jgi:hypothetical protein
MTKLPNNQEWATVSRHLQSVGSATCDVGHLILQADILLQEEKNSRAAYMLLSAARDVLHHRRLARLRASRLLTKKRGACLS